MIGHLAGCFLGDESAQGWYPLEQSSESQLLVIISDYFPHQCAPHMHSPHITRYTHHSPRDSNTLPSSGLPPPSPTIPHHTHNGTHRLFKKDMREDFNQSHFQQNHPQKKQQNSSLPKHQRYGNNGQKGNSNADSKSPRPPLPQQTQQAEDRTCRERKEGSVRVFEEQFNRTKFVSREGNSQYYQSPKTDFKQSKTTRPLPNSPKQPSQQFSGLSKIHQVTFSLDSTEPETEQKEASEYQLVRKDRVRKRLLLQQGKQHLTGFRKRIIQKQIEQKQQIYRGFIRSSSREPNQQEKNRLKSKMKEVLDDLYQLKKMIGT